MTVSTASSAGILKPLLLACARRDCDCQVFLTDEGVRVLEEEALANLLDSLGENAVACHDSWDRYGEGAKCRVTLGSQTNHSEMAGAAHRIVSL
ncbi:MAG: hypothetical protein KTR32_22370 [Granulosicoccus sp.]|nr:hypothetical protein [Granulosicoccus sp.]